MTIKASVFSAIPHSAAGRLLRALLLAQQLTGVAQVPAIKALSAIAGQDEAVAIRVIKVVAGPATRLVGYPPGPSTGSGAGVCGGDFAGQAGEIRKYHGNSHAGYCVGQSIFRPYTPGH